MTLLLEKENKSHTSQAEKIQLKKLLQVRLSPFFQCRASPFPVAFQRARVDGEAFPTVPSVVAVLAVAAPDVVPALAYGLSVVGRCMATAVSAAAASRKKKQNKSE